MARVKACTYVRRARGLLQFSQDAFLRVRGVRCLRLINSDAARCTFKSPYILGYVLDGWMDWIYGQARYKDRIHISDRLQLLRKVKWCGIYSPVWRMCERVHVSVYKSKSLFGPARKNFPFNELRSSRSISISIYSLIASFPMEYIASSR